MFKIGRTAAQLERQKLQTEIQKEQSERRQKRLEKRLNMASKTGGKVGPAKNPKKTKQEPDDDFLEDLVVESGPKKAKETNDVCEPKTGRFCDKS